MSSRIFQTSPLTIQDVTVLENERVYDGYGRVEKYTFTHGLFDGGQSAPQTRELFVSGDAVVIVPFDPIRREVLLIEQIRMAPLARGHAPWIIEAVAGRIDPGESPEDVARRESIEEAGCPVDELQCMGSYYQSPGIFAEKITYYCGRAELSQAGGIYGLESEGEDIRVLTLPLDQAIAAINQGEMVSAPTALCLLWLAANSSHLQEKWAR